MPKGPVPKRSDQKLGHRTEAEKASITKVEIPTEPFVYGPDLDLIEPDALAADWYEGMRRSSQAQFFEPSDWAQARIWTEILSRALKQGQKLSSMMIAAWSAGAAELLTTEGARRRVRIELERKQASDPDADRAEATVTGIFSRLGSA